MRSCGCGQTPCRTYGRNRMKVGPKQPIQPRMGSGAWRDGRINLAVGDARRFDGETFNAEAASGARVIRWNNKNAAKERAEEIRNRGFTARVVRPSGSRSWVVYVGPLQRRYQGMRMRPRANMDWSGFRGTLDSEGMPRRY